MPSHLGRFRGGQLKGVKTLSNWTKNNSSKMAIRRAFFVPHLLGCSNPSRALTTLLHPNKLVQTRTNDSLGWGVIKSRRFCIQVPPGGTEKDSSMFTDIPGVQASGEKMAIVFTCNPCGTRSAKVFSKQAYNHGVVLARCPKCENLHLIADRLGYFNDESMDVEKLMAMKGESVKTVTGDNVMELTFDDVVGKDMLDELQTPSVSVDSKKE